MPLALNVKKKSAIIPRADDVIYEKSIVDIGEELKSQNSWSGDEIASIYMFPKSLTLKITFSQITLAQECTQSGINAVIINIKAHEIKQKTFIQPNV